MFTVSVALVKVRPLSSPLFVSLSLSETSASRHMVAVLNPPDACVREFCYVVHGAKRLWKFVEVSIRTLMRNEPSALFAHGI